MKTFNGFYLPKTLEDLADNLEYEEQELEDARILVPCVDQKSVLQIVSQLKQNKQLIQEKTTQDIAKIYTKVAEVWKNSDYSAKKTALRYLPVLTNLSPELIEYYQFRSLYKIDAKTISFLADFKMPKSIFNKFTLIKSTGTWLRAYSSFFDKLKLKNTREKLNNIELVTYITPQNVPGFIEALGIFLANVVHASVLIKTPTAQPLFAPLYAQSIAEVSPELGETIAVIPWKGGDVKLEDVIFRNSDAVSVVSSTATANSVKQRISDLNKQGYDIKGCYHGGKFGLNIISKEFLSTESQARKVAHLSAIDGIGYEGYMCASPAFGFFVEEGGNISPRRFAKLLAEEANKLSDLIPQNALFRNLRERKVAELLPTVTSNMEVMAKSNNDYAVVFKPELSLEPIGQNRYFRVMPLQSLDEIFTLLKPWKKSLQTIGVAISNDVLLDDGFAEQLGKIGISNIRCIGTVPLPELGEAWDGNYPIYEFVIPDSIHWVSINTKDIEATIEKLFEQNKQLFSEGLLQ